ncbi:hypothetical protein PILCRDRAFT_237394 [Piloderma croceum F 1598]|uniref:Uncharacterized protein n=1 Tax=Piloderma croceum (strain F 1598) TaxID=765440 RepID=A0A0C3GDM7_PILCF|nr:hypothetical protein PILCRDRAFT_237394 [Piloderma croceum F 1598]
MIDTELTVCQRPAITSEEMTIALQWMLIRHSTRLFYITFIFCSRIPPQLRLRILQSVLIRRRQPLSASPALFSHPALKLSIGYQERATRLKSLNAIHLCHLSALTCLGVNETRLWPRRTC